MSDELARIPVPLVAGKFALYKTDAGGLHLTVQLAGEEEPRHFPVPPALLKLMKMRGMNLDALGQ